MEGPVLTVREFRSLERLHQVVLLAITRNSLSVERISHLGHSTR